jgi:acyl-CoA synthetase (AMP-forming)/AMP-acid ligase II
MGLEVVDQTQALTYSRMLRRTAEEHPDSPALVFPGRSLTYTELLERGSERARELRGLGVARGDRIGILMPNCPELIELMIGAATLGAATVPINTRFKSAEIGHVCADASLKVLFTTDAVEEHVDFKSLLHEALPGLAEAADPSRLELAETPNLSAVVLVGERGAPGMLDAGALRELAATVEPVGEEGDAEPDDPLLIMYTSGTTAKPKGCVQLHRSVLNNAANIAAVFRLATEDRWWDPLPMFHMGGLLYATAIFSTGAAFLSQGHFDAEEAFDLFAEQRPTALYPLFPTITLSLVHHPRFAAAELGELRVIGNVSPPDIQRQIQDAFPAATLISAYGMTEVCGTLAHSSLDDTLEQRTTNCGRPMPGWEARIIDPEIGAAVAPDTRGELVVRGECLFSGYYGDAEQTATSIDAEGFFHTGDHCSIDAEGYLYFHGRLKDVLKVGGENVSALEVESFLATHPAIRLAQVVGVPDERYMEVPAAFVELAPGATVTEAELIEFCDGKIARFKIPKYVRIVEEWPMSSTKVQKFRLRDQILAELEAA